MVIMQNTCLRFTNQSGYQKAVRKSPSNRLYCSGAVGQVISGVQYLPLYPETYPADLHNLFVGSPGLFPTITQSHIRTASVLEVSGDSIGIHGDELDEDIRVGGLLKH
jgi:hypothetical protein